MKPSPLWFNDLFYDNHPHFGYDGKKLLFKLSIISLIKCLICQMTKDGGFLSIVLPRI